MSCFRCGKDLPGFQTECEPPCDEVLADGQRAADQAAEINRAINAGEMIVLNFGIMPDKELLSDPVKRAQFDTALFQWMRAIGANFISTGLHKFCKRESGEPPRADNELGGGVKRND